MTKKKETYWSVSSRKAATNMAKDLRKKGWNAKTSYDKDVGWGVFEYGKKKK